MVSWKDVGNFFTKTIPSAAGNALGAVVDNVINPVFKPLFGSETGVVTPALNQFVKDSGIRGDRSFWQNAGAFAEKGGGALTNFTEKGLNTVKNSPVGLIPGVSQTIGGIEAGLEGARAVGDLISSAKN